MATLTQAHLFGLIFCVVFIQCSLFILALGHNFPLKINVQGNILKILRGRKYIIGMKKANVSATNGGPLQYQ